MNSHRPFRVILVAISVCLAVQAKGESSSTGSSQKRQHSSLTGRADDRDGDSHLDQVPHVGPTASFEAAKPGQFRTLQTGIGLWKSTEGIAAVDDQHAKSGSQCLWLTGGQRTSVTLELAEFDGRSAELTFHAERWTRRQPFSFRIEKRSDDRWEEIYNGDDQVAVGRAFLSRVRIPLGPATKSQLRFSVSSPPDTGVLLDNFRLAEAAPQRVVAIESVPFTAPALAGLPASAILQLKVQTEGSLNPVSLTQLEVALNCHPEDIENSQVFYSGASEQFQSEAAFGEPFTISSNSAAAEPRLVTGMQPLLEGENYFWIAARLSQNADIDRTVGASCLSCLFSNGESLQLDATETQRLGTALRNGGDDGINTFRIPGLVTTGTGTLIGVYDIRRRSSGDLPGDIDVGMSRSTDGGRNWEPMKVIMDMGNDPAWRYDGIGDPAILVDRTTGWIWVAATWSHGNRSWNGSGPGLEPEQTGQLMLVHSSDDGVTWSKPINITRQVKQPGWSFVLQGPGKGITMSDGTIVFAAQFQDPPNEVDKAAHRLPHSTIIYSKDHGRTWHAGTAAFDDTTESQVVEVSPGVLMLNCRYNRKSFRVVMTSADLGRTWRRHSSTEHSLIEPGACMASLIDVDAETRTDMGGWLLFSNPDSLRGRRRMTIKGSADRGDTWPMVYNLLLDGGTGRGYSCMTMIGDSTVGILYEGSQAHLTFQRIPLEDIIGEHKAIVRDVSTAQPTASEAETNAKEDE